MATARARLDSRATRMRGPGFPVLGHSGHRAPEYGHSGPGTPGPSMQLAVDTRALDATAGVGVEWGIRRGMQRVPGASRDPRSQERERGGAGGGAPTLPRAGLAGGLSARLVLRLQLVRMPAQTS